MSNHRSSFLLVLSAFVLWGVLPGYWKTLHSVPALEVLCHRVVWSAVFLGMVLACQRKLLFTVKRLQNKKIFRSVAGATVCICLNWIIYVWALAHGHFKEAGLGYFLCPLVSIALGRVFLNERLDCFRSLAVLVVASGVVLKVVQTGSLPWIALGLAFSFAFYALVRKLNQLGAVEGLFLETTLASLFAFSYLAYLRFEGTDHFLQQSSTLNLLLVASGLVTAVPLLMLAVGAPKVPLQTIAIVQFVTPTLTLLMGRLYGDWLTPQELPAYLLIWFGILMYIYPNLSVMVQRLWRPIREKKASPC